MIEIPQADRPFRDALVELTFEANTEVLDPFEAYIRLRHKMGELGLHAEDYCSSSITSGGHARDDNLSMGEVIQRNTDTAMKLCDELFTVGQLNPRTAVEAVVLGKIAWKQSDYMTFWLATMAGLPARGHGVAQAINNFRNDFEIALRDSDSLDMSIYDSKESPNTRAPHYFEHAQRFAATAQQHNPEPVHRLIRLVDPEMSLGAQTENVFARLMGTGVFRVAIAETGIEPSQHNTSDALLKDMEPIIRFGGTVFDTQRRQFYAIVPQTV